MSSDKPGQPYQDFEIRSGPLLGEGYPFIACGPGGRRAAVGCFRLPFTWEEMEPALAALRAAGPSQETLGAATLAEEGVSLQEIGHRFYNALFDQPVGGIYRQCLKEARGRLRLRLTISQPELARLPWEYLHDGQKFLGLDLATPIVRGVVTRPWPTHAERPLRLLIVGASPWDQSSLEIGRERQVIAEELNKAVQRGDLVIRQLVGERLERDLPHTLLEFAPHVLHFAGHGTRDYLILEDARGRSRPFPGASLRDLLCNIKSLQLVVLNACELGAAHERKHLSIAARLVQVGIPMAVGMQFQISDRGAVAFSEGFYEALAQRLPLEAAAAWARARISYYLGRDEEGTMEWGTPVIYVPAIPWQVDWRLVMARALAQGLREGAAARLPATIVGRDGKEMKLVPAGSFLMGDDGGPEDERPRHRVDLPDYWMDACPVTNAEYARFVAETGYKAPWHWPEGAHPPDKADHPVVNVSWEDAQAYAAWAGKRLPTEAEWEKAARGSDGRAWPWGNRFEPGRCNTREAAIGDTTPVDAYSPQGDSLYGLGDMAGNVWEWTADWYRAYAGSSHGGDSFGEQFKVLRGGSWSYSSSFARCASRTFDSPNFFCDSYGFRCVVDREMIVD